MSSENRELHNCEYLVTNHLVGVFGKIHYNLSSSEALLSETHKENEKLTVASEPLSKVISGKKYIEIYQTHVRLLLLVLLHFYCCGAISSLSNVLLLVFNQVNRSH